MVKILLFFCFNLLICRQIKAAVKWRPEMKSFTHSVKQGGCAKDLEVSLYESSQGPGVITEQWFTGKGCINQDTIVRYYIDGDEKPTIEVNLYLAHGIGFPDKSKFGSDEFAAASKTDSKSKKNKGIKDAWYQQQKGRKKERTRSDIMRVGEEPYGNSTSDLVEEAIYHEKIGSAQTVSPSGKRTTGGVEGGHGASDEGAGPNDEGAEPNDEGAEPNDDDQTSKRTEPDEDDIDAEVPWGTRRIGHLANNGGIYNTIRIPFRKSIYISFISKQHGHYWFNVRGVRNYPVIVGDLELPREAQLRVYKREDAQVRPFEYISLAESSGKSGLLYMVSLTTESRTFYHQEACFRVITDDSENVQYLSSGTEDLFLSAYYYSGGTFHNDHAGLSYKKAPGSVSAYKIFEDDPVIFNKRFALIWRCGELADNECFKIRQTSCARKYGRKECVNEVDYEGVTKFNETNRKHISSTTVNSYAWVYEW